MSLPLNALRAFAAVYETGGIRPAGRKLNVAHSAIAKHLRELELLVGQPLLERAEGSRSLQFTATGEQLGERALKSLGELEKAWLSAKETKRSNEVVISAAPSFAALWLLPRLPSLAEAYPEIQVSVLAEQRRRDPTDEGSDLAIRMGRLRDGEKGALLMDETLAPVTSPNLLREKWGQRWEGRDAQDLNALPLLHDRDPQAGWDLWNDSYGRGKLDLSRGPRFSSSDLVLRAAKQGQGVALARLRLAADDLASGALVFLFKQEKLELPDAYWLIESSRSNNRNCRAVERVKEWLFRANE